MAKDKSSQQKDASEKGLEILGIVKKLIHEADGKDEVAALIAAGKIREIAQTFQLAASCYTEALRLDSKNGEARARLALAFLKGRAFAKGLAVALDLVEQQPKFTFHDISGRPISAMTVLGDAYRDNGNLPEAKRAYTKALELVPKDIHASTYLAQIHADEGDLDHATSLAAIAAGEGGGDQFQATVRLLASDANRLPAIRGLIVDRLHFVTAEC